MATFLENQVVELREDVVEDGVAMARGSRGAIIDVYSKPSEAYEVEFVDENGNVLAQLTLSPSQIQPYAQDRNT
jgi:hypothetical protein